MRTARSSSHPGGGSPSGTPQDQPPAQDQPPPQDQPSPWDQAPPQDQAPPRDQASPLWTESQTPVKTLPSRNFVCGR